MTTTDIILRINDAIRTGDQLDLDTLANHISDLLIEDTRGLPYLTGWVHHYAIEAEMA